MMPYTLHIDDERNLLYRTAILNGIVKPLIPDVRDVALYRVKGETPILWARNVALVDVAELVAWATAIGLPIVEYTCPDMTPQAKTPEPAAIAGLEGII